MSAFDSRRPTYGLTTLQRDTLLVIQELSEVGWAPSVREVMHELGHASPSVTHGTITNLRDRGYIRWIAGRDRSIHVLKPIQMPEESEFVGFFEDEDKVREFSAVHSSQ